MTSAPSAPTQPEPAEGAREPGAVDPAANEGRSGEDPAEGADDASPPKPGSPTG